MKQITITVELSDEAARWLDLKADMDNSTVDVTAAELIGTAIHREIYGQGWPLETVQEEA